MAPLYFGVTKINNFSKSQRIFSQNGIFPKKMKYPAFICVQPFFSYFCRLIILFMVDSDFLIYTLSNGIRVIHRYADSPVAHLGILINAGSRDEKEDEHGLAHFIEHSVFKGTKKRKAFHVLSRVEDVGGELNAYTTKEETTLYSTFLSGFYGRAAELLADILFNSVYPEKEINREKEVIAEEINSYKDSPSELIFDEFEELVFDGHPIARNILGTTKNINKFNRKAILQFIENNYHTNQMVISSVGKINFEKLIKIIEKDFGSVKARYRENGRKRFELYVPGERLMEKDTFQTHCVLGNISFDAVHPKRNVMVLLNNILGGQSMNSRLNLALRERKGMAYNIESNYTAYSDTGLFSVYFGTDKENFEKAYNLVLKEFKLLRDKKLGAVQLSKAKKQLIGQIAISTDSRDDLMLTIGKSYLLYNKVDPLRVVFKKIEAITAEELMEVANVVLDEKSLSRLVYQ
jgi:predicted Zn-dependent peptidase